MCDGDCRCGGQPALAQGGIVDSTIRRSQREPEGCFVPLSADGRAPGSVTVEIRNNEAIIPTRAIVDALNDYFRKGGPRGLI